MGIWLGRSRVVVAVVAVAASLVRARLAVDTELLVPTMGSTLPEVAVVGVGAGAPVAPLPELVGVGAFVVAVVFTGVAAEDAVDEPTAVSLSN